jgi:hypothetical protein
MRGITVAIFALPLSIALPALAHHSHAMFDNTQEVTIDGTVSGYVFSNPHAFLYVDVEEENGETVQYWIEMVNIPTMLRRGMNLNTFEDGDAVSVDIHPLRDGRPGGSFTTITSADGNTYIYE